IDAQLLILDDKLLIENIITTIREKMIDAASAVKETIHGLSRTFDDVGDEYLRERKTDIDYIGERITRNILGRKREDLSTIQEPSIIVAHDLSPADTANLDTQVVMGFVTNAGGKTSHTAIMARALEIPSVVGLKKITSEVTSGETIIVDGTIGVVITRPTSETLWKYREKKQRYEQLEKELFQFKDLPAETPDGFQVKLLANIELVEELSSIREHGAEGIGLYRTEFLYLNRKELPTEEEHFNIYKKVIETVSPHPVTIRTFDLGGDKFLSRPDLVEEMNPVMGLRAIRFCLKEVSIFKTQLRALLKASVFGELKILFPMISGLREISQIKEILEELKVELHKEGVAYNPDIKIGIMIEIPSAATIADLLAKEVDFFSIGTNDLIQYTLAIDRVNENVSYLYNPLHPAVLRLVRNVVDAAHSTGISVAMCGEMAGEPLYLPILLGLGIDELSMNPLCILKIKKILRSISYHDAQQLAAQVDQFKTATEIENFMQQELNKRLQDEFQ
ncbi:MAG: phosphoenolpyruvate--protein phosphotransferase, partial [Thermodesulfobacteriota bacterium]|nr:phosphoenolpyruvate--protein phosphotransferase [Thermodesulfobacteriota bacterium]